MKVKKRGKSGRRHGKQTAFRGAKKKTRGSGNQGGKGWAGTGKRGDQKKSLVINMTGGNNYFGKSKTLRRGFKPKKLKVINLGDIEKNLSSYIKSGKAREEKGICTISLEDYKILGEGEVYHKFHILSGAYSASAQEKVKTKGGEIIVNHTSALLLS